MLIRASSTMNQQKVVLDARLNREQEATKRWKESLQRIEKLHNALGISLVAIDEIPYDDQIDGPFTVKI